MKYRSREALQLLREQEPPYCGCGCGKQVTWSKGCNHWNIYLQGHNRYWLGRRLSKEHKRNLSKAAKRRVGEKAPNWKGGISVKLYPLEYRRIRKSIRKRDNHTCQLCGKTKQPNGRKLSVHHIDYDKKNSDPKNLITLCNICNKEVDRNDERKVWTRIFRRRIKSIYKKRML